MLSRFGSNVLDPFAAKRAAMREEFFAQLFLLGGWLGGTDTYKRTMWAAVPDIALARAGYAPDHAQGPARAGRRATSSSWPATRPCWPSGFIGRCAAPTSSWPAAGSRNAPPSGPFRTSSGDTILDGQPGEDIYLPDRRLGLSRRADLSARRAVPVLRGHGRRGFLPGTGHVPLLRPDHPGDQGPADEAGHAARRRVRPALGAQ